MLKALSNIYRYEFSTGKITRHIRLKLQYENLYLRKYADARMHKLIRDFTWLTRPKELSHIAAKISAVCHYV